MRRYFILLLVLSTSSLYGLIGGLGINFIQDQHKYRDSKRIQKWSNNFFSKKPLTIIL